MNIIFIFFIIILLFVIVKKNSDHFTQYNPPVQNLNCLKQNQTQINAEASINSSQIDLETKVMLDNLKGRNDNTDNLLRKMEFSPLTGLSYLPDCGSGISKPIDKFGHDSCGWVNQIHNFNKKPNSKKPPCRLRDKNVINKAYTLCKLSKRKFDKFNTKIRNKSRKITNEEIDKLNLSSNDKNILKI